MRTGDCEREVEVWWSNLGGMAIRDTGRGMKFVEAGATRQGPGKTIRTGTSQYNPDTSYTDLAGRPL
jgi:hypothetical protein